MEQKNEAALSLRYSVDGYINEGDRALANDDIDGAIEGYKKALSYTSYRKDEEQAALVLTALGDCHYLKKEYKEARKYYQKAFDLPGGVSNAYALLRMGEVYFDERNLERARYYLLQAYLIEGAALFEDEDDAYLQLIEGEELALPEEETQPAEEKVAARREEVRFSLKQTIERWVNGKDDEDGKD